MEHLPAKCRCLDHLPSEFRGFTADEQIRIVKSGLSLDPILTNIASTQAESCPQYWIAQGYDNAMKECESVTKVKLLELTLLRHLLLLTFLAKLQELLLLNLH